MKRSRLLMGCLLVGGLAVVPPVHAGSATVSVSVGNHHGGHAVDITGVLGNHGVWIDHVAYGWLWRPHVSVQTCGWHPYRHGGHWCGYGSSRYWESTYVWGVHIYGAGGRWVLAGGEWCWLPPRGWAHCPPRHRTVVTSSCYRPAAPQVHCQQPVVRHSSRHQARVEQLRRERDARSQAARSVRPEPRERHVRAPHVPPATSSFPPSAQSQRPSRGVTRGGRLDALVNRHRATR